MEQEGYAPAMKETGLNKERVGIVGLGRMGSAMAARLAQQGFAVTGWSRSDAFGARQRALGIDAVEDLSSLAERSDVIILALIDDQAVHDVLNTLAATALTGKLIVDTSTVSPMTLRSHQEAIGRSGAALLDAPIAGGPEMLLQGKVGLYIGGSPEDHERFRPVAETLSDRALHVGKLGDGASAKLVNNMMLMGLWQNLKEALLLGKSAGLSSAKILEILAGSPAASPAMKSRLPVISGETDTVGFPVSGAVKDARLVRDFAEELGISIPAISASLASFEAALAAGYGAADLATMVKLVADAD